MARKWCRLVPKHWIGSAENFALNCSRFSARCKSYFRINASFVMCISSAIKLVSVSLIIKVERNPSSTTPQKYKNQWRKNYEANNCWYIDWVLDLRFPFFQARILDKGSKEIIQHNENKYIPFLNMRFNASMLWTVVSCFKLK